MNANEDIPDRYRYRLLNSTQAAEVLGVSRYVTSAIKLAGAECGDSPFTGIYTTMPDLMAWLKKHPDFVASHTHDRGKRRPPRPQFPKPHGKRPARKKNDPKPDDENRP